MRVIPIAAAGGAIALGAAGCPKPPPPPSATEPPHLVAEESCATPTPVPVLPRRPPADPYRLSSVAAVHAAAGGGVVNPTFLCDLPDRILAIDAEQTVESGKRVVRGTVHTFARAGAPAAMARTATILPTSRGCTPDRPTCSFDTEADGAIEVMRTQRVPTSGWVHGLDDMCRALPDDTIAVCATAQRLAYVELGCDGELQLGLHDGSQPRAFDLDVEAPVARLRGALAPTSPDGPTWTFRFRGDARSTASAATTAPASAVLAIETTPPRATLVLDGRTEPCLAWAIDRR